jgi:hypothetical protein
MPYDPPCGSKGQVTGNDHFAPNSQMKHPGAAPLLIIKVLEFHQELDHLIWAAALGVAVPHLVVCWGRL